MAAYEKKVASSHSFIDYYIQETCVNIECIWKADLEAKQKRYITQ